MNNVIRPRTCGAKVMYILTGFTLAKLFATMYVFVRVVFDTNRKESHLYRASTSL